MDLSKILQDLGLFGKTSVQNKAQELLRLIESDPSHRLIDSTCRQMIAIEISCMVCNEPYNREKLRKLSRLTENAYREKVMFFKKVLKVQDVLSTSSNTLDLLCIAFEVDSGTKISTQKLLSTFEDIFLRKLDASVRATFDLNSPAFIAAAFYIAFKQHNRHLDKSEVLSRAGANKLHFKTALNILSEYESCLVSVSEGDPKPGWGDSSTRGTANVISEGTDSQLESSTAKKIDYSATSTTNSTAGYWANSTRHMRGLTGPGSTVGLSEVVDRVAERKSLEARLFQKERTVFRLWADDLLVARRQRRKMCIEDVGS